jgi:hypothetical protein
MGKAIYFTDDELHFLRNEALEDVPPAYLTEKEQALLKRLKDKVSKAIDTSN